MYFLYICSLLYFLYKNSINIYEYYVCIETISIFIYGYLYIYNLSNYHIHSVLCITKYIFSYIIDKNIDKSAILHHIITIGGILVCYIYVESLNTICLNGLLLTSISNLMLTVSKYYRNINDYYNGKKAFIIFAVLFFITRIIGFPILISWPIYTLNINYIPWLISNIITNSIYALQIYWINKIYKIINTRNA